MAPATLPNTGALPLSTTRKNGKGRWKDSLGLTAQSTDWSMVANSLFTSIITTIVWVIVGADIIFFAPRPFPGSRSNPKGHLGYYFPDEMDKWPYFICTEPGKDPRTGKMKCPYNGWKPSSSDGTREPGILPSIAGAFATIIAAVTESLSGIGMGGGGAQTGGKKGQKGGNGDFYSCTKGSMTFDEELPDLSTKPSFPYSFAGGANDALNQGWGTASPMTALGYLCAQMFTMGRGWVKWFFEELRPYVAGGGIGQCLVMLSAGVLMFWGGMALGAMWVLVGIICALRAIVGQTTNYVGPYDEVWDMKRTARWKYWTAWYASYLVPVGLATWGGPLIAGLMVVKIVFDVVIGPLLTSDGRRTIMRILNCNAPWVMVIFGGLFLSSSLPFMEPLTWMGMGGMYGLLALYTVYKWFTRVD